MIATIQQIQKVPDDARLERLQEALAKLDDDKDGAIPVDDLLKVQYLSFCDFFKIGKGLKKLIFQFYFFYP